MQMFLITSLLFVFHDERGWAGVVHYHIVSLV
jgi:hypothetical protein